MRKHFSQMTLNEIAHLENLVRTISFEPISHALKRMAQKNVSDRELEIALQYGKVIEAHNESSDGLRILLRATMKGWHVCAVVSVTGKIITTYKNKSTDHHNTLDRALYSWKVNLCEL